MSVNQGSVKNIVHKHMHAVHDAVQRLAMKLQQLDAKILVVVHNLHR